MHTGVRQIWEPLKPKLGAKSMTARACVCMFVPGLIADGSPGERTMPVNWGLTHLMLLTRANAQCLETGKRPNKGLLTHVNAQCLET